ncbi:MAG: TonB-dependent receptor [Segetibacter sp.]
MAFVNSLKLRASWGRTGNQSIADYQSIVTYASGPVGVFNNAQTATQEPARLANPDLKWETIEQTDIGLDFGMLKNRISGSVDYYNKRTFDMLLNKPVPTSTGFNTRLVNVGSIKNTGWDFFINTINLNRTLKWSTTINFATIKNEVLNLGGISQINIGSPGVLGQNPAIISPGLPLYSFYGYQILGVWQKGDDFTKTKDAAKPGDFKLGYK